MRYFVALAVVWAVASGCGSSDEPQASPGPASSSPPSSSPASPPSSATPDSSSAIPLAQLRVTPSKDGHISGPLYIALGGSLSAGLAARGVRPKKVVVGPGPRALPSQVALSTLGLPGSQRTGPSVEGGPRRATAD